MWLAHHGVKGMKWGVRRYQNKDGTLTSVGKSRQRAIKAAKTKKDVDEIISTWNEHDRRMFMLDGDEDYLTLDQGEYVLKRILIKVKDTPVSFFDMLDDGDTVNITLGTRSGDKYRGKGYARQAAQKGIEWLDKNHDKIGKKTIIWAPYLENEGSIKIAKSMGFTEDPTSLSDDGRIINYIKKYD